MQLLNTAQDVEQYVQYCTRFPMSTKCKMLNTKWFPTQYQILNAMQLLNTVQDVEQYVQY